MGSQKIQGELWGTRTKDWASIQEATSVPIYEHVLEFLKIEPAETLLDVGCGTGFFSDLAFKKGADVTGLDASEQFNEHAKQRNPSINFIVGEMEELPFADNTFNIVSGFNSFQYAANIKNAFSEAKRVMADKGKFVVIIWGNKVDCEAATYMEALSSLLPPPPPGSAGPFNLSENRLLEQTIEETGFRIIDNTDVTSIWDYPNTDIALKGLLSSGPIATVIDICGFEKVYETVTAAIQPYIQQNGHVVYNNKFRVVISEN
jgi:SAM-dependent methyltransferase